MQKQLPVELNLDGAFLVEKGKESGIKSKVEFNEEIKVPISVGDTVGTVKYYLDGKLLGEYRITAAEDVAEISFGEVLSLLFQYLVQF